MREKGWKRSFQDTLNQDLGSKALVPSFHLVSLMILFFFLPDVVLHKLLTQAVTAKINHP